MEIAKPQINWTRMNLARRKATTLARWWRDMGDFASWPADCPEEPESHAEYIKVGWAMSRRQQIEVGIERELGQRALRDMNYGRDL